MRGGYRPGSGRPKGKKDTKPRKGSEAHQEAEQIKAMLAMGIKAKQKFYHEFLVRVANKDGKQTPLSLAEKKLMSQLAVEIAAASKGDKPVCETDLEACEFLRQVWNDPDIEMPLRIRAAEIAFKGVGDREGKKDEKANRAKAAGGGKFAPGRPPVALVK